MVNIFVFIINFLILCTIYPSGKYIHDRFMCTFDRSEYIIVFLILLIQTEIFLLFVKESHTVCTSIFLVECIGTLGLFMYNNIFLELIILFVDVYIILQYVKKVQHLNIMHIFFQNY